MFERSRQGRVDVIRGEAPLDIQHLPQAVKVLEECVANGQPQIAFDLKRVSLIDSAGLEFLLDARDQCLHRGGSLKLVSPNHLCRDILAVTGIASQFDVYDDILSAAGSFAK